MTPQTAPNAPIERRRLESIFAAAGLPKQAYTFDQDLIEGRTVDQRGRYFGRADCLILPRDAQELRVALKALNDNGVGVTPQGGNTGMCGGATPFGGALLGLGRMDRLVEFDEQGMTVTVEAGMTLQRLQEICAERGYFFPLRLGSQGSCTIGGNVATNAGGLNALRYGVTRALTVGVEAIAPTGLTVGKLDPLAKNTAGYDVNQLLIGSEGTLAVVSKAALRIFPAPSAFRALWFDLPDVEAAVALLGALRRRFMDNLTAFELMGRLAKELAAGFKPPAFSLDPGAPWSVLAELTFGPGQEPATDGQLADAAAEAGFGDALLAQDESQRAALWALREAIPLGEKKWGFGIKHDLSAPIGRIAQFVERSLADLASDFPTAQVSLFGHLGDGSLHYNVYFPDKLDRSVYELEERVNRAVTRSLLQMGGSIAAEHGLGIAKRGQLALARRAHEIELMRAVKTALDPRGVMNPGKVFPPPEETR